jgi:hypothetical protein
VIRAAHLGSLIHPYTVLQVATVFLQVKAATLLAALAMLWHLDSQRQQY